MACALHREAAMHFGFTEFEGEFAHSTELAVLRHELCQPLTYLSTSLGLVRVRLEREVPALSRGPMLESLSAAQEAVTHLGEIVRRIGGTNESHDVTTVDLADLVLSTLLMAEDKLTIRASIVRDVASRPMVRASRTLLRQVLLNLLTNASLAIEESHRPRGTITVRLSALDDGRTLLVVQDDGVGISPADLPKVSNLRFTTRPGSGSGFGLSVCRAIVEDCGGTLRIHGEAASGTTVEVVLPTIMDA